MDANEIEAWAEELQGSKMDLIDLLSSHLDLVKDYEKLQKKLEGQK